MRGLGGATAVVALIFAAAAMYESASAHLTAVSPYTYWRDVLPIFEARCGRCHGDGSVSGLSLMNYQSARGATWLMRQRLIRGHMPPWYADGSFKGPDPLTAKEINILMTWASGAGPEGRRPEAIRPAPAPAWPLGTPHIVALMPAPFTFTADVGEHVHEVELSAARIGGKMIRAVDLRAGTPALVRSAEIIARRNNRDQVLGMWQPGELPAPFAINAGFRVERGARLVLRIRYRRIYGAPASDRSEVGVYFADRGAATIQPLELTSTDSATVTYEAVRSSRVVAIRPVVGPSGSIVSFKIVRADGSERDLGRVQLQHGWARRYVLDHAVALTQGDKIVMMTTSSQSGSWSSLTSERSDPASPVRVAVEMVN